MQTDFGEAASRYGIEMNERISALIKMKRRKNQARQGLCLHRGLDEGAEKRKAS